MTVKSRREEYAEVTRAAIIEAAIARFVADGYARTTVDAIAEAARVTKGGVYHHFKDKSDLFEAAFVAMEERLLAAVGAGVAGIEDPWDLVSVGMDIYLTECCKDDFRRIALEEAPAALGWGRWKEIEERYFLGTVRSVIDQLSQSGEVAVEGGDVAARMVLAAMGEAGIAVGSAKNPKAERRRTHTLLMQMLEGFRARR
jgi:AcrR family transcriptional regulator